MSVFGFQLFCCSSYSSLTSCLSSSIFFFFGILIFLSLLIRVLALNTSCTLHGSAQPQLCFQVFSTWAHFTCFLVFSFWFNTFSLPPTPSSKRWLSPPLTFPEFSTDVRWLTRQKANTAIHYEIRLSDEIHVNFEKYLHWSWELN